MLSGWHWPADKTDVNLPPGIDAERFHHRCLGNRALMAELLTLFATHAPPEMTRLRRAIDGGDVPGARASAHKLKSSASTIAATVLHALLVDCEQEPTAARVTAAEQELQRCLG